MIPDRHLDKEPIPGLAMEHERELLKHEAESLRTFYSLTGPARKDYTEQMADAEAYRVRQMRQAQAEGLLAIRKAEAEGYRLIGEALAGVPNPEHVIEIARLHTLQRVAEVLADGNATKIFIPQDLAGIFSILTGAKEATGDLASVDTARPE